MNVCNFPPSNSKSINSVSHYVFPGNLTYPVAKFNYGVSFFTCNALDVQKINIATLSTFYGSLVHATFIKLYSSAQCRWHLRIKKHGWF